MRTDDRLLSARFQHLLVNNDLAGVADDLALDLFIAQELAAVEDVNHLRFALGWLVADGEMARQPQADDRHLEPAGHSMYSTESVIGRPSRSSITSFR